MPAAHPPARTRLSRTISTALLSLAFAAGTAGLGASPASATGAAPTASATLSTSSTSVSSGDQVVLHVYVRDAAGAPVGGVPVTFYRELPGGEAEPFTSTRTDPQGHTVLAIHPDQTYRYDAIVTDGRYAGTSPTSTVVQVGDAQRLALRPSDTVVPPGHLVALNTYARDAAGEPVAGATVAFYRKAAGGSWEHFTTTRTDSTGRTAPGVHPDQTYRYDAIAISGASPTSVTVQVGTIGQRVLAKARAHYGAPYQWGATGPAAFDCSGFTQYVYAQAGIDLPRTSSQQYRAVRHVPTSAKQPGDLIFYYNNSGRIYHVGIYAGGNTMWASPNSGEVVSQRKIWTSRYYVGRPY